MATGIGPHHHVLITGPPGVGKTTLVKKVCAALIKQKGDCIHMTGFYTEEVRERGGGGGGGGRGRRVGFDIVNLEGDRGTLARLSEMCQGQRKAPTVGQYTVDISSFERIALPTITTSLPTGRPDTTKPSEFAKPWGRIHQVEVEQAPRDELIASASSRVKDSGSESVTEMPPKMLKSSARLFVVDEIGKMELFSREFVDSVKMLFDGSLKEGDDDVEMKRVILATIPVPGRGKSHWLLEHLRSRSDCKLFQVTESNRDALVEEIKHFLLQLCY